MRRIFQIVCCSTLAALGLLVLIYGGLQLRQGLASRSWPRVPGRIISSELKQHTGRTKGYSLEVEYSYAVNGDSFRSRRIRAVEHVDSKPEAEAKLERYRAGREVDAFYNPAHPAVAFLERGVEGVEILVPVIGLAVAGLAGIALRAVVTETRRFRQRVGTIAVKST